MVSTRLWGGATITNGTIYGKDSEIYNLYKSYFTTPIDESKLRFSFQMKWTDSEIERTTIFINDGTISRAFPRWRVEKLIQKTNSSFNNANANEIIALTNESINAYENSSDADILSLILYQKGQAVISSYIDKDKTVWTQGSLPFLRTFLKQDWHLDELKLHNIDPASLGILIGSGTSTSATSTTLKATDFLATLDPAAIAGIASAKELFSANQIAIAASSWSGSLTINLVAVASNIGDILTGKQVNTNSGISTGSILVGGLGNDQLWGKAGWDIIDGGAGNDLIRGGNGRDILTGGAGSDEIHGDFGWNTYKSEIDGFSDLIAIKSDQYLVNWIYGKAGNNADGSKCDIIEGLDSIDRIRIIGCDTKDLTFANTSAKGLSGVGIYAKGALEALYTGNDLSIAQIQAMTTGDGSAAAMANQINSYGWTTNPSAAEFTPTTTTDAITGQQLIFSDLGTIESDKVYGKENYRWLQPIVNNLPFTQRDMDLLTEFKIEFEFNDEYIVATGVIRGDTRQTLSQYMGSDWTARLALKGKFEYSQGFLNSASIETAAVQLVSQSAPFSIGSANVAILDPQVTSKKSITVTNPASWDNVLGTLTRPSEFSFINGYTPLNSEKEFTTKEMLKQFGGGRFFYSGWETNPFNSNLL